MGRAEAVEFASGVLGGEAQVDGKCRTIAFRYAGGDGPFQAVLVAVASPQSGSGQQAALNFRHPLDKLRTGFNQLPCLGVWWNSGLRAMRRASGAGKVSYRDAIR